MSQKRIPVPDLCRAVRMLGCSYNGSPVYRGYAAVEGTARFKLFYFIRCVEHVPYVKPITMNGIRLDSRAEIVYYRVPADGLRYRRKPRPSQAPNSSLASGEPRISGAGGNPLPKNTVEHKEMVKMVRDKRQLQMFVTVLIEEKKYLSNPRWKKAVGLMQHGAELLWRLQDQSTLKAK